MNLPPAPMPLNRFSALPGTAVLASDELDRLFAELELSRQTIALRDAALQAAELKIQALALELAHHRRIRFGQKGESLAAAGQGDLFGEDVTEQLDVEPAKFTAQSQTVALTATLPPPRLPAIRLPPVRGHRRRPCPCVRH